MDKSYELRDVSIFPYPKLGINNGGTPANGDAKLRSNVMQFGSMRLDFDVNIYFTKADGLELKVVYLLPDGPILRVRFELPSISDDFNQKFDEGDHIFVNAKGGAFQYEGNIEWSDGQFLELALSAVPTGWDTSSNYFDSEVLFRNQTRVKSIDVKYNLSPSDKQSFSNGFDGGNMIFSGEPSNGVDKDMFPQTGSVKNWLLEDYTQTVRLENYETDYQVPSFYPNQAVVQPLTVRGIPYIVPYWREDLENVYQNDVSPPDYIGDKQLRMVVEIKCWKNKQRTHEPFSYVFEIDSDTGWYGENGNGGEAQAILTSIDYQNLSQARPVNSLDMVDLNQFTIVLDRTSGVFSATNNIGVSLAKKAGFEEYYQSKLNHSLTYLFSAAQSPADGVNYGLPDAVGKQEILSLESTISNGGQTLTIVGTYQAKVSSQLRLDIGDPYILGVSVWDSPSNQLIEILADDNTYTRFTDETGLIELVKARVFDPDADPLDIDNEGYSDMSCWNEDGLSVGFKLKQQVGSFGEIEDIEFKLLSLRNAAANGFTDFDNPEDFVVLQTYQVPFSKVSSNANGLPIYEGTDLRDFNLDNDDPFKLVNLSTVDNGAETEITLNTAFKVNWQYWNLLANVPDVFYNPLDAHNGYNQRTSNYSDKPVSDEYDVMAVMFITCKNRLTPFSTTTAIIVPMRVFDYGEDKHTRDNIAPNDFPDFTGEIFTEKLDGTPLGGSILTGEPTKIKTHFTNNGRDPYDLDFWFMTRIEEDSQPSYDIWEISNLRLPAQGSLLVPVNGEIAILVYPDGADGWWTECQTDPSKLDPNTAYKLSSRMGKNEDGEALGAAFSFGYSLGFNS